MQVTLAAYFTETEIHNLKEVLKDCKVAISTSEPNERNLVHAVVFLNNNVEFQHLCNALIRVGMNIYSPVNFPL